MNDRTGFKPLFQGSKIGDAPQKIDLENTGPIPAITLDPHLISQEAPE